MSTSDLQKKLEHEAWAGPKRRYDIIKEGTIALVVVAILTVGLAALIGAPDDEPLTFQGWAKNSPQNFVATTVGELAGTTESAGYGPPYNSNGDPPAHRPDRSRVVDGRSPAGRSRRTTS